MKPVYLIMRLRTLYNIVKTKRQLLDILVVLGEGELVGVEGTTQNVSRGK